MDQTPDLPAPLPPAHPDGRRPVSEPVTALLVLAAVTAAGVPFGLVWSVLAPDVPLVMTEGGPVYAEAQPEQVIAADGWFVLLGVPLGILLAAGVWRLARRLRGVPGLLAVTGGAAGTSLVAWWLGRRMGLAGYRETLAAAEPGAWLDRPPDLAAAGAGWWPPYVLGVLLVPALVAAATYTLLAAWSPYPGLHPEPDDPAWTADLPDR